MESTLVYAGPLREVAMTQATVSISCVQAVTGRRWIAWGQLERCPADFPSPFPSKLIAETPEQKLLLIHSGQGQVCAAPWVTVQGPGNPFSSQVPLNHTREMSDEPSARAKGKAAGGLGQQRAAGGPELYFTSLASSRGGSEPWMLQQAALSPTRLPCPFKTC